MNTIIKTMQHSFLSCRGLRSSRSNPRRVRLFRDTSVLSETSVWQGLVVVQCQDWSAAPTGAIRSMKPYNNLSPWAESKGEGSEAITKFFAVFDSAQTDKIPLFRVLSRRGSCLHELFQWESISRSCLYKIPWTYWRQSDTVQHHSPAASQTHRHWLHRRYHLR